MRERERDRETERDTHTHRGVLNVEMLCSCYIFYDRTLGPEEVDKNTTNPYSSLSRNSGNGNYEIMQLNDVSNDHNLQQTEHNECTYIEVIEHEYDYTYGDLAPASLNIL